MCGAPCEAACRRGDLDQSVSIRALKRFVTDRFGGHAEEAKRSSLKLIQRLIIQATNRVCERGMNEAGDVFSAIIKDETKCIRCALCAFRCPVGAITMERVGFSSRWEVSETTGSESA